MLDTGIQILISFYYFKLYILLKFKSKSTGSLPYLPPLENLKPVGIFHETEWSSYSYQWSFPRSLQLIPWKRFHFQMLIITQLVKKLWIFYVLMLSTPYLMYKDNNCKWITCILHQLHIMPSRITLCLCLISNQLVIYMQF